MDYRYARMADDNHVDRDLGLAMNFRTPHFRSPHAGSQQTRANGLFLGTGLREILIADWFRPITAVTGHPR